jgi:hypothetical protein
MEAADHVRGPVQPQFLQGRGGQAGGEAILAEHHDPVVIPTDPGQPGVRARIQTPFQVVALHHDRAGYLAFVSPLRGRPDIDQHSVGAQFGEGLARGHPHQPVPRGRQHLLNRAGTGGPGRYHAAAPSVSSFTRPPGVRS